MNKENDILDYFSPLQVIVRNNNIEEGARRFKQVVQKDGVLNRYREAQVYEKPSVRNRRKKAEAWHRKLMADKREKLMASGEWDNIQKKKEAKRLERVEEKKKQQAQSLANEQGG